MLELSGHPSRLALPRLCACCGAEAGGRIRVRRAFARCDPETSATTYVVTGVDAPFCRACLERHRREEQVMDLGTRLLLCFRSWMIIPALGGAVVSAIFALQALRGGSSAVFAAAAAAVFGAIGLAGLAAAWRDTRRLAIPPPTSVSGAFDFSDDISNLFESPRRRYFFHNAAFAQAFAAVNQSRRWNPAGASATRARLLRRALLVLLILACAAALLWERFGR